jgi:hypothetical protein
VQAQCGDSQKACTDRIRARGSGPDGICCWGGSPGHGHEQSVALLDELTQEILDGHVRTVEEAHPLSPHGPHRVSMRWLLAQDVWWYPQARPAIRIAHMARTYRWNTARWLERRAPALQADSQWDLFTGFLGADMPDDVATDILREDPMEFLRDQPLYRALAKDLPKVGSRAGLLMAARARHWHTCPMRKKHPAPRDTCVCVRDGSRIVGASNDPASLGIAS